MLSSHILDIYRMGSHGDSELGHEVEESWIMELLIAASGGRQEQVITTVTISFLIACSVVCVSFSLYR